MLPLSPQSGLKNAKCPKFEQYCVITFKLYEIECQLVLITNRKSHTGFRLVPTSVTLYDLECHNSPYFALFHIALQANYVTVVEDIRIMSTKYRLPVTSGQSLLTQQLHSLSATVKLLVIRVC